jgi:ribosomal protein S18 acetylase RimI-like enzyme
VTARLRIANRSDAVAMAIVFVAAWRGGYRGIVPDEVIASLQVDAMAAELAGGFDRPGLRTVVAEAAGRVVGFVRFGDDPDRAGAGDTAGYLAALYVQPDAAGHGVGTALLQHALDAMAPREITLWVFEGNERAGALYARAGFRPTGVALTDPRWRTPQLQLRRPGATSSLPR